MISKSSLQRNFIFNVAGATLPLLTSLYVIPIFLHRVGSSRFGIISLIWLLFGYFGLFDFGLSQATTNLLARTENLATAKQREIFWSATIVNALFGVIGAITFFTLSKLLVTSFFRIPIELAGELRSAIPWVACLIPISTTSAVFAGALEAHERFLALNVIQVVGAILGQFLPLIAVVFFGTQIAVAVEATTIARVLTSIPICVLAMRQCGMPLNSIVSRDSVRALFGYGGWVTVSNIVGPILVSVDQFMIGAMIGVGSVPRYSIPFNIATKILIVPSAMTRALFPELTRVEPEAALRRATTVAATVSRTLVVICAPLIVICSSALTAWLGPEFSEKASLLTRIIILGVWINGVACVPSSLINSQRRPSITAKIHVCELPPFFLLLWLNLHYFGLVGAAVAWSLRVLVDAILLFWAAKVSIRILKDLVPSALFMLFAFFVSLVNSGNVAVSIALSTSLLAVALLFSIIVDPNIANAYANMRSKVLGVRVK